MGAITHLISLLHAKTMERRLVWETDSDNGIWVRIGASLIDVTYNEVSRGASSYVVSIRNEQGTIVDQDTVSNENPLFDRLHLLFSTARRAALKVDETLDAIMSQLEKL